MTAAAAIAINVLIICLALLARQAVKREGKGWLAMGYNFVIGIGLLGILAIGAISAFAREEEKPPPQLPPCMPVSLAQMSWTAKSEEALRFVPVYLPINIFKARVELKPKGAVTIPMKKVAVKKKGKRIQVCKRRNSRRCTWWIWVAK